MEYRSGHWTGTPSARRGERTKTEGGREGLLVQYCLCTYMCTRSPCNASGLTLFMSHKCIPEASLPISPWRHRAATTTTAVASSWYSWQRPLHYSGLLARKCILKCGKVCPGLVCWRLSTAKLASRETEEKAPEAIIIDLL